MTELPVLLCKCHIISVSQSLDIFSRWQTELSASECMAATVRQTKHQWIICQQCKQEPDAWPSAAAVSEGSKLRAAKNSPECQNELHTWTKTGKTLLETSARVTGWFDAPLCVTVIDKGWKTQTGGVWLFCFWQLFSTLAVLFGFLTRCSIAEKRFGWRGIEYFEHSLMSNKDFYEAVEKQKTRITVKPRFR